MGTQTDARNERLRHRIPGANGRWYNPRTRKHGTTTGVTYWGCCCDPCLAAARDGQRRRREARQYNLDLLAEQQVTESTPELPEQSEPPAPPEPQRLVVTEPVGAPDLPIPQMLSSVQQRITSLDMLNRFLQAYHNPQWTVVMDGGREKRVADDVEVIVGENDGPVLAIYERQPLDEPDFTPKKMTGIKKSKGGGGGSSAPTDVKELLERLPAIGCSWEHTRNGHIKVLTPTKKSVILPGTTSDWRSTRNAWSQIQRALRGTS